MRTVLLPKKAHEVYTRYNTTITESFLDGKACQEDAGQIVNIKPGSLLIKRVDLFNILQVRVQGFLARLTFEANVRATTGTRQRATAPTNHSPRIQASVIRSWGSDSTQSSLPRKMDISAYTNVLP